MRTAGPPRRPGRGPGIRRTGARLRRAGAALLVGGAGWAPVTWASAQNGGPVDATGSSRDRGAVGVDRSTPAAADGAPASSLAAATVEARAALDQGWDAYRELRLDEAAQTAADGAETLRRARRGRARGQDDEAAAEAEVVYRALRRLEALTRLAQGDEAAARAALRAALRSDPGSRADPGRFPPDLRRLEDDVRRTLPPDDGGANRAAASGTTGAGPAPTPAEVAAATRRPDRPVGEALGRADPADGLADPGLLGDQGAPVGSDALEGDRPGRGRRGPAPWVWALVGVAAAGLVAAAVTGAVLLRDDPDPVVTIRAE